MAVTDPLPEEIKTVSYKIKSRKDSGTGKRVQWAQVTVITQDGRSHVRNGWFNKNGDVQFNWRKERITISG